MNKTFFDTIDVNKLSNLELLARQVVEGFLIGMHKSPFHGFSVEFAEHRLYNTGDSTKNIDWKVYARTNRLFSKKYEEETNLRSQIVIDASSSMYFPQHDKNYKGLNKLQFSAVSAASLMHLLKRQRDSFGLSIFDSNLKIHTNCKTSTTHYRGMLGHLHDCLMDNELDKKTSTSQVLHEVAERIHKRSLVIIFSDMFQNYQNRSELYSALQHLKYNKHEVILFQVNDSKYELDFEFDNRPMEFIDMESGEKVKLEASHFKKEYIEKVKHYKDELVEKCLMYKIDYIDANIHQGYYNILREYLLKRKKLM